MKIVLIFSFVTALCWQQVQCTNGEPIPSPDLHKCVTWGDPGVLMWHPSNSAAPLQRVCQNEGMYELIRNQYLTLSVRVRQYGYMVELTLNFFNGTSKKPICSMVSDDFYIDPSDDCKRYGISHRFVKNATVWALHISYPRASFTTIITHMPKNGPAHFCANMWQPKGAVSKTTGMCSTGLCSSRQHSVGPSYNTNSKLSSSDVRQLCQLHYDKYLNKLSLHRSPQQRNARYNGTIQAVFDQCLFDVSSTGMPSAALSGLEVLMVEDITTDAVTLDDIATNFEARIENEIGVLAATIREADVQIKHFLKQSI